jgi:hypothetical protein
MKPFQLGAGFQEEIERKKKQACARGSVSSERETLTHDIVRRAAK